MHRAQLPLFILATVILAHGCAEESAGPIRPVIPPPIPGSDATVSDEDGVGAQEADTVDHGDQTLRPLEPGVPELRLGTKAGSSTKPPTGTWDLWGLEISGLWLSAFGEELSITSVQWGPDMRIVSWDNDTNTAVTQNTEFAEFAPGLFNRVVWTEPTDEGFYYCVADFGKETAQAASDSDTEINAENPEAGGCAGFAWTGLSEAIEVAGDWKTGDGEPVRITAVHWEENKIVHFSNNQNFAVTQNPPDAFYFPDHYNKLLWTHGPDGTLYVCLIDRELESMEEVLASEHLADATSPTEDGCRDEPWTALSATAPEISGFWEGDWGELEVTADAWGPTELILFDDAANWAVTRNTEDDEWNPGTYTRRVWTEPVDNLWYTCDDAFGLPTLEEAMTSAGQANPDDLETGCGEGGLPWTAYWRQTMEVVGSWEGPTGTENITEDTWGNMSVVSFDNEANWAIIQNPEDVEWHPGKFARVLWTEPAETGFHYCVDTFGADTAEEALAATMTADSDDKATGCDGSSWTHLTPAKLEVSGDWVTESGSLQVSDESWGTYGVLSFDNLLNRAVLKEDPPEDGSGANGATTYGRVLWTEGDQETFYFCMDASGMFSAEQAESAPLGGNPGDTASGCLNGPWTKAWKAPLELVGSWTSAAGAVEITATAWNTAEITWFDNATNRLVVRYPMDDTWSPGKYVRRVWTEIVDGVSWYCEDTQALDTADEAKAAPDSFNTDDMVSGCGSAGFGWTQITLQ